jgi:hypothetical protein
MGLSYWDSSSDAGNKYGVHAVRLALGLSFGEQMDPSPKAAAQLRKTGNVDQAYIKKFYDEKRVPRWFRYGAAAYVERYYHDKSVAVGGNPKWVKEWSVQNILGQGGLRPLKQVFEFNLRFDQGQDGAKLISETGLLVAFAIDGKCAPVEEKLKAVQAAIKTVQDTPIPADPKEFKEFEKLDAKNKKSIGEAFKALEAAIVKHEAELRKFAGL